MEFLGRWIWKHGPGNPLLVRIVESGSRRRQHAWVRFGYLAALIGLVMIGLLGAGAGGQSPTLSDLAVAGSRLFALIAFGQVVLICLLAPFFMAGAIGREHAGRTLDVLLTTPLTNLQIVLGSLLGRLFFILALLLSGLPLFAVLLFFGGVPLGSVFVAFAVAALTALFVGAVAVALSVLRLGGRKVVFGFVIAVGAYLLAGYALDWALLRRLASEPGATTWLTPLHPLLVLEASLSPVRYQPPEPATLGHLPAWLAFYLARPLSVFTLLSCLGSALLLAGSTLVLRRLGQGEAAWVDLLRRRLRLPSAGSGAARRRQPREVWTNPVAWREAATRGRGIASLLTRWGYLALALLAGILWLGMFHRQAMPDLAANGTTLPPHEVFLAGLQVLLLAQVAVVSLVAIFMSAGSVSREREDGTLDLILTTPMTARRYIWGKLRGLIVFLAILIAVPVLTLVMVSVYALVGDALDWQQARYTHQAVLPGGRSVAGQPLLILPEAPLLLAMMLLPWAGLCAMTGMNWSVRARGVFAAVVPTVGVIGVVTLLLALCGLNAAREVPFIGPIVNAFSPATSLIMITRPYHTVAAFPADPAVGRLTLLLGAILAAAAYAALVYAMLSGLVRTFDFTVRKMSGR